MRDRRSTTAGRRSPVLDGRIDARDRARSRGRHDRPEREDEPPDRAMARWLAAHPPPQTLATLERLSLDRWLAESAVVRHPAHERLRFLAIALEPTLARHVEQPDGWRALDRVYVRAVALAPDDPSVHRSRAVSARVAAEWVALGPKSARARRAAKRMLHVARDACLAAIRWADPGAAEPWVTLGHVRYEERETSAALAAFDEALARDPREPWALLFRAHCLHDLARWREAALAYDAVPRAFFVRHRAWRYEHLLEQRAYCRLRAGDVAGARDELLALLARWEKSPSLALEAWGAHVRQAARGVLAPDLAEPLAKLAERARRERESGRAPRWPGLD